MTGPLSNILSVQGEGIFSCRPILSVNNLPQSLDYYKNCLGFTIGLTWSDAEQTFLGPQDATHPTWALVGRDKIQLMLSEKSQGSPGMWLHFDVQTAEEIDQMYEQWSGQGARILESPSVKPWGMYELRVQDLDQHTFRVSSPPRKTAI